MMNAAQHPELPTSSGRGGAGARSGAHEVDRTEALSALVDGEIDAAELDAWLRAPSDPGDDRARWHSYQVIGDVLRGSAPAAAVVSPQVFLAGVQSRLRSEPTLAAPSEPVSLRVPVRAPAANDAVFRWKLVAGVASLAAVMAVSWGVIGGAPSGVDGVAGPQMALLQPTPAAPTAADQSAAAVLVHTERGTVIRDARLQALLAEHRQHGGMSALHMPAGFLRDATHDVAPQR